MSRSILVAFVCVFPLVASAECPVDLAVVFDKSGSMRENDPGRQAIQAVEALLARLVPGDRLTLVEFATRSKSLTDLLPIETGRDTLVEAARGVKYNGAHTDIGLGLEKGFYALKESGRPAAGRVVVLLTDGAIDLKPGADKADRERDSRRWILESLTAQLDETGARVFAIAFTDNADFALLQEISRKTHGDYFRAIRGGELEAALEKALAFSRQVCVEQAAAVAPRPAPDAGVAEPTAAPPEPEPEPEEPVRPRPPKKKAPPPPPPVETGWPLWAKLTTGALSTTALVLLVMLFLPAPGPAPEAPAPRRAPAPAPPPPPAPPSGDGGTQRLRKICPNHSSAMSTQTCFRCRKDFCDACVTRVGDRWYCRAHLPQ